MSDINIVLENRDDIHVAVEEKDINVEVPAGKDGRSLRPRGEWSASAAYAYLDLVSYQGSSYVATKAVPAGTLPTNTSYWMLSAEKGEPGTPEWGAIAGDLSDQTDLQAALDAKADVIISSASGSIASFSDGSPAPVTALSVSIEPVQDLHGYDNPWPAGGGKNLLDPSLLVVGTFRPSTGEQRFDVVNRVCTQGMFFVKAGTYTFSVTSNQQIVIYVYDVDGTYLPNESLTNWDDYKKRTITLVGDRNISAAYRFTNDGVITVADITGPQLELGSSATSWAPYSNICPISGHTSATVTRVGKNVLDWSSFYSKSQKTRCTATLLENGDINFKNTNSSNYGWIGCATSTNNNEVSPSNCYTISAKKGDTFVAQFECNYYGVDKDNIVREIQTGVNANAPYTITNENVVKVAFRCSGRVVGAGNTGIAGKAQIERSSSASDYQPYNEQTVTIDLDGTRYGGVIDVLTGEMTVTKVLADLATVSTWYTRTNTHDNGIYIFTRGASSVFGYSVKAAWGSSYGAISSFSGKSNADNAYNGNGIGFAIDNSGVLYVSTNSATTVNEFKTFLSTANWQICAELATPLTVTLSPSQISTLLGQNHIWADTGDVSVWYRADTKLYIDGVASATAKVTRQMIADSATADGKAPKSLATGDLIIVGDELRKATANIGNGSAITASNSTTATLADVIKALQ